MLHSVRLSPQFSPLFPCTSCGKPVLTYRRFRAPSVVIPGSPTFQALSVRQRSRPPPSLDRPPFGQPDASWTVVSILPRCPVSPTIKERLIGLKNGSLQRGWLAGLVWVNDDARNWGSKERLRAR